MSHLDNPESDGAGPSSSTTWVPYVASPSANQPKAEPLTAEEKNRVFTRGYSDKTDVIARHIVLRAITEQGGVSSAIH